MWEINNSFQLFSFFVSIIAGIIYCMVYDILRALRKSKATDNLTVFLQDVLYFILIGLITFLLFMSLSNGEIRGYLILGIAIGFALSFVTISRLLVKILCLIFKFGEKVSDKIISEINCFFDFIGELATKQLKKLFNYLAKLKNIKKPLEKNG